MLAGTTKKIFTVEGSDSSLHPHTNLSMKWMALAFFTLYFLNILYRDGVFIIILIIIKSSFMY